MTYREPTKSEIEQAVKNFEEISDGETDNFALGLLWLEAWFKVTEEGETNED